MGKKDIIWADMAQRTTVLMCDVGSRAFGCNLESSDYDHKAVCVEDLSSHVRLDKKFVSCELKFEPGVDSAFPTGRDLQYFALDRFLKLVLGGNPTLLTMLYSPIVGGDERGKALQGLAPKILSHKAGVAYLGFMNQETKRLEDSFTNPQKSPDWKRAMHVLRLGLQGIELLEKGTMTIPLSTNDSGFLQYVRRGDVPYTTIQARIRDLEHKLKFLMGKGTLPEEPDYDYVDTWARSMYWNQWQHTSQRELLLKRVEVADDLPTIH